MHVPPWLAGLKAINWSIDPSFLRRVDWAYVKNQISIELYRGLSRTSELTVHPLHAVVSVFHAKVVVRSIYFKSCVSCDWWACVTKRSTAMASCRLSCVYLRRKVSLRTGVWHQLIISVFILKMSFYRRIEQQVRIHWGIKCLCPILLLFVHSQCHHPHLVQSDAGYCCFGPIRR